MENDEIMKYEDITKKIYNLIKRCFDLICGVLGCLLMIPVMIIIKICYMLDGDFSSIFYKQARIGKNGKRIYIYKFRSMVKNADIVLEEMLKQENYRREWEENQKFENDPRITRIGKVIRKNSMDEIPQFINVLKGEMSLIGPRPLVDGELDLHGGNHDVYESVKPGITGWWACNGRSSLSYYERLKLEYFYIENQSLLLDVKCIIKTAEAVFKKNGAK